MKLQELRDLITFEAKLQDSIDVLGGWLDWTIPEIFDDFTAQIKYQELYVPGIVLALPDNTGIIPLPTDVQHLDIDNIRYRYQADTTRDYPLTAKQGYWGTNIGMPYYLIRNSTSANLAQIQIWPTEQLTTADQIVINYWRRAIPDGSLGTLELVPRQLVTTVKHQLIARANLFGDSKQAVIFKKMADEAHGRSLGATDLSSTNG